MTKEKYLKLTIEELQKLNRNQHLEIEKLDAVFGEKSYRQKELYKRLIKNKAQTDHLINKMYEKEDKDS